MRIFRNIPRIAFLLVTLFMVVLPSYPVNAGPPCSPSQSSSWQICGPIQAISGINQQPTVIQASDGTLRLAWTHITLNGLSSIYYSSRLPNGTWSGNSSITNLSGRNTSPSLVQAANGTVFLFWGFKPTLAKNFQIYYRYLKGSVWSSYNKLPLQTATTLNDTQPSAAVGRDGMLWLFWVRDNFTVTANTVMRQLWYETLNSTAWSVKEQSVTSTSDNNWNFEPSLLVGKDGVLRLAFSRGQSTLANFQVNYIYRSGSGWTAPRPIVASNSTADDEYPSLIQDRNGTLWVFWMRNVNTNFVIRSEYSWDNGTTWRGESLLTASCSGCADSRYPAAVQSSTDKNLWVFYSTNPSVTGFDLFALETVNPISPVHDIDISNTIGSYGTNASLIYAGGFHNPYAGISQSAVVLLSITIMDPGDFVESASVTMRMTNTTAYSLGTQTVSVTAGGSTIVSFSWNTSGLRPARYGISANASIPIETVGNRGDNVLAKPNIVHLLPLGDVDQDGSVTLTDVSVVFYNYGFSCFTPATCSPRYNPFADPHGFGIIDIVDVGMVSKNFDIFT
jgi:hypothetical protein